MAVWKLNISIVLIVSPTLSGKIQMYQILLTLKLKTLLSVKLLVNGMWVIKIMKNHEDIDRLVKEGLWANCNGTRTSVMHCMNSMHCIAWIQCIAKFFMFYSTHCFGTVRHLGIHIFVWDGAKEIFCLILFRFAQSIKYRQNIWGQCIL